MQLSALAQELNCNVTIDAQNVQMTAADKALIEEIKLAITNFMNNRKWTDHVFNPEERIKCNIFITIKAIPAFGSFEATGSIQSSRPVFESAYESTLLNYFDNKFYFEYNPSQQMDYNENTFFSNLTSMLAYYAYVIIGTDYDSFSKLGGSPYFEKARNIANVAQFAQDGWTQGESTNNRYWFIENLNNQQLMAFREGMYTYHRLAMDKFIQNSEQSRIDIYEVLKKIKAARISNPYSILIKSFFLAKVSELVNIYSEAAPEMKKNASELLRELDPLNTEKYSKITQ
jgi:hypothetical protein